MTRTKPRPPTPLIQPLEPLRAFVASPLSDRARPPRRGGSVLPWVLAVLAAVLLTGAFVVLRWGW